MTRYKSPSAQGLLHAKICFIGEAPSHFEVKRDQPFVGPAGKVFDQCLHAAGLSRHDVLILNVFPFMVKKLRNSASILHPNTDELLWDPKGGMTPAGMEYAQGTADILKRFTGNIIVPMGGPAFDFVSGNHASIMKWRGSPLWSARWGMNFIPTIHPAASIRGQYIYRYLIINDMKKAKRHSKTKELKLPGRELIVDPSYADACDFLDSLGDEERFAFDIEAVGYSVSCISFAPDPSLCMSIPFASHRGKHNWPEAQEREIWTRIAELLQRPDILKIGQNVSFDISFLLQYCGIVTDPINAKTVGDTMIAHHILYPDLPKGLDMLTSLHTDEPYYKDDGKLWNKVDLDWDLYWTYNAKDSAVTLEVWENIADEIAADGYWDYYAYTIDSMAPIIYLSTRGMRVDDVRLHKTKDDVRKRIAEKQREVDEAFDYPINPASPRQLCEYFYDHMSITPYTSRKTGKPTVDDKALARIWRRYQLEEAKLVQELRALTKLEGTYLDVSYDDDQRLRSSYDIRGTTTGRLSSKKTIFGTGLNMQNLPYEFKGFLVADE